MRTASQHSRRAVSGFTLLEMLIAVTIGLVILASSLAVYVASSRGSQMSQVETQLNEDGILALTSSSSSSSRPAIPARSSRPAAQP